MMKGLRSAALFALVLVSCSVVVVRADFICTEELEAQFTSMFVEQTLWARARDTASLCDVCEKIARNALEFVNDDSAKAQWAQAVRDNACTYMERHRSHDCSLIVDAVLDKETTYFTSEKAHFTPAELATTETRAIAMDDRSRQFCTEVMCCREAAIPAYWRMRVTEAVKNGGAAANSLSPTTTPSISADVASGAAAVVASGSVSGSASGGNGTNSTADPLAQRSVLTDQSLDEMRQKLAADRAALDGEKRLFDKKKAMMDAFKVQLDAKQEDLKRQAEEIEHQKKLIFIGEIKADYERHIRAKRDAWEARQKQAATEAAEEDKFFEQELLGADKAEQLQQGIIASGPNADAPLRDAYVKRAAINEEGFKAKAKAYHKRREQREEDMVTAKQEYDTQIDEEEKILKGCAVASGAPGAAPSGTGPTPVAPSASASASKTPSFRSNVPEEQDVHSGEDDQ